MWTEEFCNTSLTEQQAKPSDQTTCDIQGWMGNIEANLHVVAAG